MKCLQCERTMKSQRESYDYSSCGLPVTLIGVRVARCGSCGEHEVVLPRIEELHRLIARTVIRKRHGLSGPEVRFLRKWLGWSGKDFAEVMGVTPETVSRWEAGSLRIGPQAERLLRMLVATQEPRDDYPASSLRELEPEVSEPEHLTVKAARNGWRVEQAA